MTHALDWSTVERTRKRTFIRGRALCGELINDEREDAGNQKPTCPDCLQIWEEDEAESRATAANSRP